MGTVFLAVGAALAMIKNRADQKIDASIQPYVEKNAERLLQVESELLDVPYTCTPIFSFEVVSTTGPSASGPAGQYVGETQTLHLLPSKLAPSNTGWVGQLERAVEVRTDADRVIAHEFGHHLIDQWSRVQGRGMWPCVDEEDKITSRIGLYMINEGLAKYAQCTAIDGKSVLPANVDLSAMYNQVVDGVFPLLRLLVYEGGFQLVQPVLDQHGKRGIEFLLEHPPSDTDMFDLGAYQSGVLGALETTR